MALCDVLDLPPAGVLAGIDPGGRRWGLAASDRTRLIASPAGLIERGKKLAPAMEELATFLEARRAAGLVIGLPLNMDGSAGPRAQSARAFAHQLGQRLPDLPLAFQDERLSSAQAERVMIDADLSRKRRRETLDASAAAIILQTALDRLRSAGRGG